MVSKFGPLTFTPIGARIPLCSMTIRAAIGWSFGALVVPGTIVESTISAQMSSADRGLATPLPHHWTSQLRSPVVVNVIFSNPSSSQPRACSRAKTPATRPAEGRISRIG